MGGGISRLTNYANLHQNRRRSEESSRKSGESSRSKAGENNSSSKAEENNSSSVHRNNDRVITDRTFSAKLLDNQKETNSLNSQENAHQTLSSPRRSISSPPNTLQDKKDENISSPRRSISSPSPLHNKNDQMVSSPRQSISSPKSMIKTIEKSNLEQPRWSIDVSNSNGHGEDDHKRGSDYHGESDDEYGRRISDYDGYQVGSPSFREYCAKDYLKTNSNTCDGEKVEGKPKVEKVIPSSKPKEDPTPVSTKKPRKKRGIKKVISMGNPSAMRNLLHVSACYNPHVSASREKLPKPIEENV